MKKLRIKDADGEIYEVEEVETEPVAEEPVADEGEITLTADEIAEIKALLPQLKELIKAKSEAEPVEDEDIDETIEEDKEEVVDSCNDEDEDEKITDSAASKKKTSKANDSIYDEDEIVNAWKQRYESQLRGGRK